jgi:archaellum component FlaG (FlaF/FlaG flagellin family)
MKLFMSIVAAVALSFTVSAQKSTDAKVQKIEKAPITFKNLEVNKPNIAYGADETFTFDFKNTGKTPIIITNVQTSCGCTTANKPTEPVAPGKSSSISVKYDTKRVGDFVKTITVTTNVGDPIVLTIKGKVAENAAAPAPMNN